MSGLIWVQTVCKGYRQTTIRNSEFVCVHVDVFMNKTMVKKTSYEILIFITYGSSESVGQKPTRTKAH